MFPRVAAIDDEKYKSALERRRLDELPKRRMEKLQNMVIRVS